jgi:hypothetical protein
MFLELQQRLRHPVAGALNPDPITQKVRVWDLEPHKRFFRISMEALRIPTVYKHLHLAN